MRRDRWAATFVVFSFCLSCRASAQASQTPPPPPPKGLIHRTPEMAEQQKKAERHIALSVIVTDASGTPVDGLTEQDFAILDNNHVQKIASFEEIDGRKAKPPVEAILVFDTINPSFDDLAAVRSGVEKFLKQNGGHLALPVSIVFLSYQGVKLAQPSRDGNTLAADFDKLPVTIRMAGSAQGAEGWVDRDQRSIRALTKLSEYEATKPNRKLLIWLGPGWPMLSAPSYVSAADEHRYFTNIVNVSTGLRDANITLYSVRPSRTTLQRFVYKDYLAGVRTLQQASPANLAVEVLAYQSGGLTLDPGDVAAQINRCLADAGSYYEISFDSAPAENVNEYHGLDVKVDKPNLTVRTRTLYYAQP
jgi:VWFA-related protein